MDDSVNCRIFHMGQTASIDQNKMKNSDIDVAEDEIIVESFSNQENQSICTPEIVSYSEYCDFNQSDSTFIKPIISP